MARPKQGSAREQHHPDLVVKAKRGDHQAFAQLLKLTDRAVRTAAWRMIGDAATVDDVLQDAYLKAFRSLDRFDPNGSATFGSWLYRIVHSVALDHHRRSARRPQSAGPVFETEWAADDGHAAAAQRTALRHAFAELEPQLAAAVALVDGEGYSQVEAAAFLGIGSSSVGRHLAEGRRQLTQQLLAQGVMP